MTSPRLRIAAMLVAVLTLATSAVAFAHGTGRDRHDDDQGRPLIIGHRGASGYRPEHTLASYELAARLGADYIEPDLVSTKDGVLVARHENEISGTTDVAQHPEFADRRTTKTIDGQQVTGWFTEDFTLAELKTLRAKERLPQVRQRNTIYDGRFGVPTFQEVIDLQRRLTRELGRPIGIYPETKHPTYFRSIGLDLTPPLVRTLRANHLDQRRSPIFVQSFESPNLQELHRLLPHTPLVRLTTSKDDLSPQALRQYATFAKGLGPDKATVTKGLVDAAHAAGLVVHPYTFRPENQFLPADLRSSSDPNAYGNLIAEIQRYRDMGVDGLFTDTADIAVEALRRP